MHILLLELEVLIPASQSLKDKRSVIRSMKDRIRNRFNVSVAEVQHQDKWQRAGLAFVTVSGNRDRAQQIMDSLLDEVESLGTVDVIGIQQDWL